MEELHQLKQHYQDHLQATACLDPQHACLLPSPSLAHHLGLHPQPHQSFRFNTFPSHPCNMSADTNW